MRVFASLDVDKSTNIRFDLYIIGFVMKWNKNVEITVQFVLWVLLFAALISVERLLLPLNQTLVLSTSTLLILIGTAYINTRFIIPNFFKKGKFVQYFLLILGLLVMATLFNGTLTKLFIYGPEATNAFFRKGPPEELSKIGIKPGRSAPLFFITIAVLFISTVYALAKEFLKKENRAIQLEKEKVEHELKFLRTQINPHFLFNALNNLHATVQLYPKKAGDFILKLGGMLRYVLEDCNKDKVSLADEIAYIKNYIFFQKQKDEALQNISFEVSGDDPSAFQLEPMIFIPLVENAFQHSYPENGERQYINIRIKLNDEVLHFTTRNNLVIENKTSETSNQKRQSIGIQNVKRRLELLYPGQHIFTNGVRNDEYQVELIIKKAHS